MGGTLDWRMVAQNRTRTKTGLVVPQQTCALAVVAADTIHGIPSLIIRSPDRSDISSCLLPNKVTMTSTACCFRSCPSSAINPKADSWMRIRLDIHDGTTPEDRKQWPIFVDENTGMGAFHQTCWERVRSEHCRKRSKLARLIRQADDTAELFDGSTQVQAKAVELAQLIRQSKHLVVFTGAGVSTAAGIGDFRGLFGQWTQDDMATPTTENADQDDVPYEDLRPTLAHEALHWLMEQGTLKYIVTQNCDGLHRLSGVPGTHVSELHGNIFIEYCRTCGVEFERNKDVCDDQASLYYEELEEHGSTYQRKPTAIQCPQCRLTHETQRKCPSCKMPLHDTIINFGDDLRESQLLTAREQSKAADLILVLGSTLMVTPAANLCKTRRRDQRLVICNRQETAHDDRASLRVHGDCDEFMAGVLKELMGEASYHEWIVGRAERRRGYDVKRGRKRRR